MKTVDTSYSKMVSSGAKFLLIKDFNRDINPSNVRRLKAAVEHDKCFLRPIIVIPATIYFKDYPEHSLCEINTTKAYTKDSPTVEKDYVVLDGQHRLTVYNVLKKKAEDELKDFQYELPVEVVSLPETLKPLEYIYTLNTTSHSWTDKDRTKYIVESTKETETGLSVAQEWQKNYGLGIRNAMAIIQFNDCYKATMQKQFMNDGKLDRDLKSTPNNIARGKMIFKSFQIGFNTEPKLMKNMAPILSVIQIYSNTDPRDQTEILDVLVCFFKTIDSENVKRIASLKGQEAKKSELLSLWDQFKERYYSDSIFKEELIKEADVAEKKWERKKEETKKKK